MSNSLTTMTTGPYPRILHRHAANCMCRARHVLHWPPAENWASIVAHAEFLPQTDVPTITRRQVIEVLSEQIDGRPQPIVFTVTAAICRQQCYLTVDGDFGMPASIFDPHQPGEQHASCWFREATGQTEEQHKVWDFTLEELRMACEREGAESGALFADANAKHGPQLKIFWRQFENGVSCFHLSLHASINLVPMLRSTLPKTSLSTTRRNIVLFHSP